MGNSSDQQVRDASAVRAPGRHYRRHDDAVAARYGPVEVERIEQRLGLLKPGLSLRPLRNVGSLAVSLVQAVSVALAPRLASRFGLVPTMVGTHLPSNVLLAAVAFAPTFPVAVVLLLARTTLSQMDVPTRQALVMTVVTPAERTPAAAVTNAARYTVRPLGPLIAGVVQNAALGAPLLVAGTLKAGYDLALWRWARQHNLATAPTATATSLASAQAALTPEGHR